MGATPHSDAPGIQADQQALVLTSAPPFVSRPDQDASTTIRGFVYQAELTILDWIRLPETAHLELEQGEDVAQVVGAWASAELTQIKVRQRNVTLRDGAVAKFLADSALHRAIQTSPSIMLRFTFLTTAAAGTEQGGHLPSNVTGIDAWERIRSGQLGAHQVSMLLQGLQEILLSTPRPQKCDEDSWKAYRAVVADLSLLKEFISVTRLNTAAVPTEDVRGEVLRALQDSEHAHGPTDAEQQYAALFVHVFRLLTTIGLKRLDGEILRRSLTEELDHRQTALLERVAKVNPSIRAIFERIGGGLDRIEMGLREGRTETAEVRGAVLDLHAKFDARFEELSSLLRARVVGGDALHDDIVDAAQFTLDGKPELAVSRFERIRERRWQEFDARARYRYYANLGSAFYALGRYEDAARSYLDAHAHMPKLEDAVGLRVLALSFLDDKHAAYEAACAACRDYPHNSRAHSVRIRTAPPGVTDAELRVSLPAQLTHDAEVLMALHQRSRAAGDLDAAEAYAREATRDAPNWAEASLALGTTLLTRVIREQGEWADGYDGREEPATSAHRTLLEESKRLFTHATSPETRASPHIRAMAHFNRAAVHGRLGDQMARLQDLQDAYRGEASPDSAISLALAFEANHARDQAIDALEGELRRKEDLRVRVVLADYMHERGRPDDRVLALRALREGQGELRAAEPDVRFDYLQLELSLERNSGIDNLRMLLDRAERDFGLSRVGRRALEAQVLLREKERDQAKDLALGALSLGDSGAEDQRFLARILEKAGAPQEALELRVRLAAHATDTPVLSRDVAELLRCAHRNQRDDIVVDQCARIRERGTWHREVAALELSALLRLEEYERAAQVFNGYVQRFPTDFKARAHRSWLGIHLGKPEMVVADPAAYPAPQDAGAEIGTLIAVVLSRGGSPLAGTDYAYRLLRCFPDEPSPHQALISMRMPGAGGARAALEAHSDVQPGTAVELELASGRPNRWIVIEDAPEPPPSRSRDEFAPSESIARALIGRRAGDAVDLPGGFGPLRAKVLRIVSKYDYRAHRSADTWERMFPDTPFVSPRVTPKQTENPTPKTIQEVLGDEFIEDLKRAETHREQTKRAYRDFQVPIAAIAHLADTSFLEVLGFLASSGDVDIRVCQGRREQFRASSDVLDRATHVVVDEAGLGTLFWLKRVGVLEALPFKCIVPQGFLDDLRASEDRLERSQEGEILTIGLEGGEPRLMRFDKETVEAQLTHVRTSLELLGRVCEVVGGLNTTRVAPEHREWLGELTSGTAQAISTAATRKLPIWTDDAPVASLALGLGAKGRTWTQAVYLWLKNKGAVTQREVDELSGQLTCARYRFTGLAPTAVLLALEQSGWSSEREPARTLLGHLSEGLEFAELARFLAGVIGLVWRNVADDLRVSVTMEVLKRAGTTADGRRAALAIGRQADSLYPLEPIMAARIREVIAVWSGVGKRSSSLILPPSTGQLLALTSRSARCPRCHSEAEPIMMEFRGRLLPCCERCRPR